MEDMSGQVKVKAAACQSQLFRSSDTWNSKLGPLFTCACPCMFACLLMSTLFSPPSAPSGQAGLRLVLTHRNPWTGSNHIHSQLAWSFYQIKHGSSLLSCCRFSYSDLFYERKCKKKKKEMCNSYCQSGVWRNTCWLFQECPLDTFFFKIDHVKTRMHAFTYTHWIIRRLC